MFTLLHHLGGRRHIYEGLRRRVAQAPVSESLSSLCSGPRDHRFASVRRVVGNLYLNFETSTRMNNYEATFTVVYGYGCRSLTTRSR
ncbi:hypothetical protein J6590_029300, partial [Homalodisca vitripennis]